MQDQLSLHISDAHHENTHVEFCLVSAIDSVAVTEEQFTLRHVRKLAKELIELLLALVQFATAIVVNTEKSHDTVNDEKAIVI